MNRLVRAAAAAQILVWAGAVQAGPFDQNGPFVEYSLTGQRADTVSLNTAQWVTASGATQAPTEGVGLGGGAGQAAFTGLGGVGLAKVSVSASGSGFSSWGWSGWTDQFIFSSNGLEGTMGQVTFQLNYNWTNALSVNPGGEIAMNPFIDVNLIAVGGTAPQQYQLVQEYLQKSCSAANVCTQSDTWDSFAQSTGPGSSSHPVTYPTFADGVATFSFDVVFGHAYSITIGMNAGLQGKDGSGTIDATHTLLWGGVQDVKDAAGHTITAGNYSVASATALDYGAAVSDVPEPQSLSLMVAGLALLAGLHRRWR